jgi:hypothetical protein
MGDDLVEAEINFILAHSRGLYHDGSMPPGR